MKRLILTLWCMALSLSMFAQLNGINIALNKATTSSSNESAGMASQYAVDGNSGTRWASAWNDDEWITIDLGSRYGIDTIIFNWQSPNSKAAEASIQGSYDGKYWFEMQHFVKDHALLWDTILLSDTTRFIKMQGIQRSNIYGYSTYEIYAYAFSEVSSLYVDSLSITPEHSDLDFGDNLQLSVSGFDQNNDAITLGDVTWSVDNGGLLSETGLFTANKIGDFNVVAISEYITDTVTISVTSASPVPSKIVLTPTLDTIYELETSQLTATVYDQNGVEMDVDINYSSSINPIDETGLFTANFTGDHIVEAAYSAQIGSVEVSLSTTSTISVYPTSKTNIALDYEAVDAESALTPAFMALDNNVGTRWESAHGVDPVSWVVQLDTIYDLGAAKITWQNARAQSYNIDISNDSTNWETIYRFNPDDTTRTSGVTTIDSLPLLGSAQFVRVYGISRITIWGYSFWEFELFESVNSLLAVNEIEVTPSSASIDEGEELQLTAEALDIKGNTVDVSISWKVTDDVNADISDNGLFVSTKSGVYEVVASFEDYTDTAKITVLDVSVLDSIAISPEDANIDEDETQQYTALGYDQFGQEISFTASWTANSGNVSTGGLFEPSEAGEFKVYATSGSVKDSVTITVNELPYLDSIAITPDNVTIDEDETQQYTAIGYDQFDQEISFTASWTANSGSVSTGGLFEPSEAGEFKVYATSGSVKDSVTITVNELPYLDSIAISPDNVTIDEDETQQYTAIGYDQFDQEISFTASWTANSGSVSTGGLFEPSEAGEFKVYATSGSVKDSVTITVNELLVLTSIEITPDGATLRSGEIQQFSVQGFDQNADLIASTVVWSVVGSGDITVGGLYTAAEVGNDTVWAVNGSIKTYKVVIVEGSENVRSIENIGMSLYPNPVVEFVTLDLGNLVADQVAVINSIGKIVYLVDSQAGELVIDLSNQTAGLYIVQISIADKVYTKNLLKK